MDPFQQVYQDYSDYIKAKNEYELLSREEILDLKENNRKFCQQLLQKVFLLTNTHFLINSPAQKPEDLISEPSLKNHIQNYNKFIHLVINLQQEIKINS
jgi:hypothetical protein